MTADGEVFEGRSVGAEGVRVGEAVFNTSMTGYQEVLSDPSYAGQVVVMTSPHIGNYGVSSHDDQAASPAARGLIVRSMSRRHSNWRAEGSLAAYLISHRLVAISDLDTRRLTRHLRDRGAMPVAIGTDVDAGELSDLAASAPRMEGQDLATGVTTAEPYRIDPRAAPVGRVVAMDLGMKRDIGRRLVDRGLEVHVLPATSRVDEILDLRPDGVFLSNGPGDPEPLVDQIAAVRRILGKVPLFGICLGHQVLGLALGATSFKLPFGHHGGNHPVRRLEDGRVEITAQNHGFAVDLWSLAGRAAPVTTGLAGPELLPEQVTGDFGEVRPTHQNLNDGTLEGLRCLDVPAFSVQYHPEAAPGPQDAVGLFDDFMELMGLAGPAYHLMPKRTDLRTILLIGSGPIVIGQACEFDYSGTQAAKVLRAEGYRVVLVNSNPATIMTDPEFADATYLEPITPEIVERIIQREAPDALLPTLGGQTALNVTAELARSGVLDAHRVELIGAGFDAIERAEDRGLFKKTMAAAGIESPRSRYARSMEEAMAAAGEIGYPLMVRPSFILGGGGTGVADDEKGFVETARRGLEASPVGEILVEESLAGWKEFELEVMADRNGNAVIVCSIENLDPMGVHTGDSITVAPVQTLSDREYQEMRNDAITCLRAIGVQTGGSNVQFAVDPRTGRRLIIEMNPRVSRSSALASKATGFPIAKIAALLAVGYTLDEIANDITGATPACFEPVLDYTVVKVPRFDFAKFPSTPDRLGTSMRSVGEVMAIGRTFPEALQKALRSLETGRSGLNADPGERSLRRMSDDQLAASVAVPTSGRIFAVGEALRRGRSVEDLARATGIDPWFLDQMAELYEMRALVEQAGNPEAGLVREAKRMGFSDAQLSYLWGCPETEVREFRRAAGIRPTYKRVDTCAAEFEARTPYFYSTYEDESEVEGTDRPRVVILGSGPNRIGQGIEFDYCCVHASFSLKEAGYETVMVNCNPETVSTDYDTSDRLYFEPLTVEDVLEICDAEDPVAVVVQLGGQTPLNLARRLESHGVPIAGTAPDRIDEAEDRERFSSLCRELGIPQPPHGTATSPPEAREVVERIGLPVLVRPSYVLGGRAMRVVYSHEELLRYLEDLYGIDSQSGLDVFSAPVLIDRFLEAAVEVDVDAIYDGREILLGGVMEHVEEAGVHSGDSACITPPPTISEAAREAIVTATSDLAAALEVRGLVNIQFAVKGDEVFLLEANPRGSRTVPFIAKASGVPLAKIASRVMLGASLRQLAAQGMYSAQTEPRFVAVKEAVLPWDRFPEEDTILGPEMRATGEVMGIGREVGVAYAKAMMGAGAAIPTAGTVFLSFADPDKPAGARLGEALAGLGFRLLASRGTAAFLGRCGVAAEAVHKVGEGPNDTVQRIEAGEVDMVINTPRGRRARGDGRLMRRAASSRGIPIVTTIAGGEAVIRSLRSSPDAVYEVCSLQDWHA